MAETHNTSEEETHSVEGASSHEGQDGSLENDTSVTEPATPATEGVEEPGERDEAVDGQGMSQHEPSTLAYRCSVYGYHEQAIVHSEDAEAERRRRLRRSG